MQAPLHRSRNISCLHCSCRGASKAHLILRLTECPSSSSTNVVPPSGSALADASSRCMNKMSAMPTSVTRITITGTALARLSVKQSARMRRLNPKLHCCMHVHLSTRFLCRMLKTASHKHGSRHVRRAQQQGMPRPARMFSGDQQRRCIRSAHQDSELAMACYALVSASSDRVRAPQIDQSEGF